MQPCCSGTIFILSSYSLYTQVIQILILTNIQYLQNVVFSFEKGLSGQSLIVGFPPPNRKILPRQISHSPYPSMSIGKLWTKDKCIKVCLLISFLICLLNLCLLKDRHHLSQNLRMPVSLPGHLRTQEETTSQK